MHSEEYTKIDKSISMLKANIISIVVLPVFSIPLLLFAWIWDLDRLFTGFSAILGRPFFLFLGFILLIVGHELLHGLTYQILASENRGNIEYGFQWKTLTPYAHIKEPIGIRIYRWGTAMPGLVLGILPMLAGLVLGSGVSLVIGVFMTYAASGDMMVLYLLRDIKSPAVVEDHPTRAGCYVLTGEN